MGRHDIVETNYVRRSVYCCDYCGNRTLPCRFLGCQAMARGTKDYDDEFCFVHKGIISSWNDASGIEAVRSPKAYCSSCLTLSAHDLVESNTATSDLYQCCNCNAPTKKCSSCRLGFAVDTGLVTGFKCAACSGTIASKDWSDVKTDQEALLMASVTCSHCGEVESIHRKNATTNVYTCLSCQMETKPCVNNATCKGMSKQPATIISSSATVCVRCTMGQEKFESFLLKKQDYFAKFDCNSEDYGAVIADTMSRKGDNSLYREYARKGGMERIFLLVVSCHPRTRHQVALLLGIDGGTLFSEASFGDPHAEGWLIVQEMMKKSTTATEKLNPLQRSACYFELLQRTVKEVSHIPATSPASVELSEQQALKESQKAFQTSSVIDRLERMFLSHMAKQFRCKLSPVESVFVDEMMKDNKEVKTLIQDLISCGYTDPLLHRFLLEASLQQLMGKSSYNSNNNDNTNSSNSSSNNNNNVFVDQALVGGADGDSLSKEEENQKKQLLKEITGEKLVNAIKDSVSKAGSIATTRRLQRVGLVLAHIVVVHALPVIGFALTGVYLAHRFLGTKLGELRSPLALLLLHHVILCVKGIDLEKY